MGYEAEVIAVGPFSQAVAEHLGYPAKCYASTREGVTVLSKVFFADTTAHSCILADCFGVDLWDFNQHELDPNNADLEKLKKVFDEEMAVHFLALRAAGFRFYYMPNG